MYLYILGYITYVFLREVDSPKANLLKKALKSIGGRGRMTEWKIKELQKYYGLANHKNTIKKTQPRGKKYILS